MLLVEPIRKEKLEGTPILGRLVAQRFYIGIVILLSFHLLIRILAAVFFPPFVKEAIYWQWSHFLSLGYMEHPPLIAWLLSLSSGLTPEQPLATSRMIAVGLGTLSYGLIYRLARRLFHNRQVGLWSLIVALSLPGMFAINILFLTDTLLMFFSLIFVLSFYSAVDSRKGRYWYLAGVALGFALLSKLLAVLPLISCLLYLLTSKQHRKWLLRKEPYIAGLLAFAVFSPYLYWNWQNSWPTIHYHLWIRHQEKFGFSILKLAEVVVEQLGNGGLLVLPMLGGLVISVKDVPHNWKAPLQFLRWQSLTVLFFFMVVGAFTETHPHWTLLAYPPALIVFSVRVQLLQRDWWRRCLQGLIVVSFGLLVFCVLLLPILLGLIQKLDSKSLPEVIARKLPKVHHTLYGWDQVNNHLTSIIKQYDEEQAPLIFTANEETACMLGLNRSSRQAVSLAPVFWRKPQNQDYYFDCKDLIGRSGVFLTEKKDYFKGFLAFIFKKVESLAPMEIKATGFRYYLYKVSKFRPDVFQKLNQFPPEIWWHLTQRNHLNSVEIFRTSQKGPWNLRIRGWMGYCRTEAPPHLEVRCNGRIHQKCPLNADRPDVVREFHRTKGRGGSQFLRSGFDYHLQLPESIRHLEVVAITTSGEIRLVKKSLGE